MFKNNKKDTRMFIGIAIKGGARTPAIILDGEHCYNTLSVLRQMGESQNGCFKKKKTRQILQKTNIPYPLIRTRTCAYQGVRKVHFSRNLACFVFLKYPF